MEDVEIEQQKPPNPSLGDNVSPSNNISPPSETNNENNINNRQTDSLIERKKMNILLQKRAPTKQIYPNMWEVVGEHLKVWEELVFRSNISNT